MQIEMFHLREKSFIISVPVDVFVVIIFSCVPVAEVGVEPAVGWQILPLAEAQVPPVQRVVINVSGEIGWLLSSKIHIVYDLL